MKKCASTIIDIYETPVGTLEQEFVFSEPYGTVKEFHNDEWWAEMEEVFHLD